MSQLAEAKAQLLAEAEVPAEPPGPGQRAEMLTRGMKTTAVKQLGALVQIWQGVAVTAPFDIAARDIAAVVSGGQVKAEVIKTEPTAGNSGPDSEPGTAAAVEPGVAEADASATQKDDAAVKTSSAAQADMVDALRLATKSHGIGYPQHLRSDGWVMAFQEQILDMSDEAASEKGRLMFRRYTFAVGQLLASIKGAAITLKTHLKKLDSEKEKAVKKEADAASRTLLLSQKENLNARAQKITKAIATFPSFFSIECTKFDEVQKLTVGSDGGLDKNFTVAQPCIIAGGSGSVMDQYLTQVKMQQVLTSWGGRYKKLGGFKDSGHVANTLCVKQGKEETESFFATLLGKMKDPIDLSIVSPTWNTTSWLWGYKPKEYYNVGFTPQGTGLFKIYVMGCVHVWLLDLLSLTKACADINEGDQVKDHDSLMKYIAELSVDKLQELKSKGAKVVYHKTSAEDMMYIPAGQILVEKSSEDSLIYGMRKSFLFNDPSGQQSFSKVVDLKKASGQSAAKMKQVLGLFSTSVASGQ